MTTEHRLERDLPSILGDLAMGAYPDYIDDVLATTAQRRQRPVWTYPERWLPMSVVTRRPTFAPTLPWRTLGIIGLLGLLIAAAVVAYIGSQTRLPPPFGPARNGLVTYAVNGDIHTADPVTGVETVIVAGPDIDLAPRFSLDGTHLVFERKETATDPGMLYVSGSDGTEPVLVTPEPLTGIAGYAFSPSGQEILISTGTGLHLAKSDGSGVETLPIGDLLASEPDYAAPDGAEIVFVGSRGPETATGLYAIRPDGGGLRTVVEPTNLIMIAPRWSPDGSRIAFSAYATDYQAGGSLLRAYVVSSDGGPARLLRDLPENDLEGAAAWSNDGTRLLVEGCYDDPADDVADCLSGYSVIPLDASSPVVKMDFGGMRGALQQVGSTVHVWAPDDRAILTVSIDSQGRPMFAPRLSDPVTGRSEPWAGANAGFPSWQRLAP